LFILTIQVSSQLKEQTDAKTDKDPYKKGGKTGQVFPAVEILQKMAVHFEKADQDTGVEKIICRFQIEVRKQGGGDPQQDAESQQQKNILNRQNAA
jgi:hypothetical protein